MSECEFVELPCEDDVDNDNPCAVTPEEIVMIMLSFFLGTIVTLTSGFVCWKWLSSTPRLVGIYDTCQMTSYNTEMIDINKFMVNYAYPEELYVTGGSAVIVDYSLGVFEYFTELPCVSIMLFTV